jgi:long-chain acyl-CoA synthetase
MPHPLAPTSTPNVTLRRRSCSDRVAAVLQLNTLNDIFFSLDASPRDRAMLVQAKSGVWTPISTQEVCRRVRAVASAVRAWGITQGDRVAILSENRWEWAVADFACLAIGAVDVPLYPTLLAEQIRPLLADSGARIVFVSSRT